MSGNRHSSGPHAKPAAGERKETPIRTFSEEYAQNPNHSWMVKRINSILSRPEGRAEELAQIRSAIYDFSVKVDGSEDTLKQLVPLLGRESVRPELRDVWEIRAAAALILGGTRSRAAVPALVSAFENEGNTEVREAICLALGTIGLEGAPLRRFSEALVVGLDSVKWEGPKKKTEYMQFLRRAFYEANFRFQPPVLLEPWQKEFLTQALSGRQNGSEGASNWHMRASAALLLGASSDSSDVLPNLVASAARDVHEVGECARMAAVRIGRNHFWRSDVKGALLDFIAPSKGERTAAHKPDDGEKMAGIARQVMAQVNELERFGATSSGRPSQATLDLLSPRQKFIGMLRNARESGDYSPLAREFPAETVIRNMLDEEYVRITPESVPELKAMFSIYLRAISRSPEVYPEVLGALIDSSVEELLEVKKQLDGGQPAQPKSPLSVLSREEARFIALLNEAYQKGDYSALVNGVKMPDAIRMLVRSASANLEEGHLPFLKRITSDVIKAGIRARGPKAFYEAAEALYEMALTRDLYVHHLSQAVADMISTPKKRGR